MTLNIVMIFINLAYILLSIKHKDCNEDLKWEDIMRVAITTLLATAAMTTTAFAANGAVAPEPGLLVWAAIGLCAAVLVGQTIPAIMLALGTKGLHTPPNTANHL
jgi:hypothetical protein